jgi:hypothetical protein
MLGDMIEVDVPQVRPFLREVLADTDARDALEWLDDRGLSPDAFDSLLALASAADPQLVIEVSEASADNMKAGLTIGKRFHLKLRRTAWQLVLGVFPTLIATVAASASPADLTATVAATITAIVSNLERLVPDEWLVYLVVRQGADTRADVVREMMKREGKTTKTDVERRIQSLVIKGVLAEDGRNLQVVS